MVLDGPVIEFDDGYGPHYGVRDPAGKKNVALVNAKLTGERETFAKLVLNNCLPAKSPASKVTLPFDKAKVPARR